MNSDETLRIEPFFERRKPLRLEVGSAADVDRDRIVPGLDVVHRLGWDDPDVAAVAPWAPRVRTQSVIVGRNLEAMPLGFRAQCDPLLHGDQPLTACRTDSGVSPVQSRNARKNELGSSNPMRNEISA